MMQQKSVRWSTITVYEFGVGIGGSAVPKRGGPAVGLARTPECVWSTTVDAVRSTPLHELAVATFNDDDEADDGKRKTSHKSARRPAKRCRQRRVRWLKPLERVSMLEKAGYSERRIYRMLMESAQIAMSRRLCLRLSVDAVAASTASDRNSVTWDSRGT